MKNIFLLSVLAYLCTGCFQTSSDESELRTVPVTNNPYVVPSHSNLPGTTGAGAGPY